MLGNVGEQGTIVYTRPFDTDRPTHVEAIRALTAEMNAGKVDSLLILGGNPVYNAPADLNFGDALKRGRDERPPERVPRRDLAALDVAFALRPFSRILGRRPLVGRDL